ncbi:MAG: ferric reductase-like transmembrane domain-containing protein [Caldilineaceae bacterium]
MALEKHCAIYRQNRANISTACAGLHTARLVGVGRRARCVNRWGCGGLALGLFTASIFWAARDTFHTEAWENVWFPIANIMDPSMFFKVPFARFGLFGLLLLIPLALTSNRWAMRRLGKNWKRLHRLVYIAVPLLVWHYWQRETWESTLGMGRTVDWTQPVLLRCWLEVLLVMRIPRVRKLIREQFQLSLLRIK